MLEESNVPLPIAWIIAIGDLFRRENQAPNSLSLTCPNGVSAVT